MRTKQLLTKTLLVVAVLLAGVSSAWAETYMTSMTGLLGLEDNTTPAWTYYSKIVTIKAGETYVYTFTNYTKGSSAAHEYETWITEIREETSGYCLDARGDGDGWTWDNSSGTLNYSYSGKAWNDGERSLSDFMTAYNGVPVTLTISCSNDGKTVTIARSATLSDNTTDYSGTWTCSNFVGNDKTIKLLAEASHLNITNVVYTNASGDVTHYDLKNVDLSKFDANSTYLEGVASFTLSGSKWSKLDLSSYYSGISGTITNINMKFTENIGTGGRMCFGIFGSNKSAWNNGMPETANSVSTWGICGSSNPNRVYYGTTPSNVNTLTVGSAVAIEVDMDMINKQFTFIQAGSNLVTNQSFIDAEITSPQYFAGHTWTNESNATTLTDMTMEIVYLETTYYTATFTNTTSGNTVSATIYTDSERSSEISNGMLEDGETYYFTATEEGYQNYNGSFTVSSSDPDVSFAMTAKTVYNFSAKAVDGGSTTLQADIASGTCYADESTSFYIPAAVLYDGTLYFTTNEDYKKDETVTSNNQVFSYAYTANTIENVSYFYEGESLNVNGTYGASSTGTLSKESKGSSRRPLANSYLYTPALAGGVYTVYMHVFGNNAKSETLDIYYCDADGSNPVSLDVTTAATTANAYSTVHTDNLVIPDGKSLCFYRNTGSNSNYVIDYIYLVKCATATLGENGYTTFACSYPLNVASASMTASAGTATAYKAAVSGTTVNFTALNQTIPANTGILLKGTAGATVTIPVVASGTTVTENAFLVNTSGAVFDAEVGYTYYAMIKDSDPLTFGTFAPGTLAFPATKAYLKVASGGGAPLFTSFADDSETTGISASLNDKAEMINDNAIYNLNGQRVAQPTKGLYIVNGKKVVIK